MNLEDSQPLYINRREEHHIVKEIMLDIMLIFVLHRGTKHAAVN